MKTKVDNKRNEITSKLVQYFGKKVNLSRIKFIGMFLCALCKVQTVGFDKLLSAFDSSSERNSFLRRIHRFISSYVLDQDLIAPFIVALLPTKPPFFLYEVEKNESAHHIFYEISIGLILGKFIAELFVKIFVTIKENGI